MTEELITELSRIQSVRVISRTSVTGYKGTKKRLPQIARELGVDGIVEGSVSREGDQVRVTLQLLDGPNDRHLWSEDYQRELGGILSLQREIAQAIAQQVRAKVTPQQQSLLKPALAVNPEAYDAYLQGRFYMSTKFSQPKELKKAKGYFEDSIRKDPNFALSYVGGLPEYQKAVEMSNGDQDATAALAHAYAMTGKRAEAEKILRDLERKSKTSHVSPYMIATVYAGLGDKDKAFEFLEKAYQERCWDIVWCFKADPRVDNLRSDPASRLCKKM